jgi:hypothetical protein
MPIARRYCWTGRDWWGRRNLADPAAGTRAMNPHAIRFRCPGCRARIKSPVRLAGHSRACPGCGQSFTVPRVPADALPVLVLTEGEERCTLGVSYRHGG